MRRVCGVALFGGAIALACTPFEGAEPGPASADGGAGDASAVADAADPADGGSIEDVADAPASLPALYEACPPPQTPVPTGPGSAPVLLAVPPTDDVEYPFDIVTDHDFVYWVAQWASVTAPPQIHTEAYNGKGLDSRIRRVPKAGRQVKAADTILAPSEGTATAIALDGDYVYWGVPGAAAGAPARIRRVRRDCAAPCTPEDALTIANFSRIHVLARLKAGVLAVADIDGRAGLYDVGARLFEPVQQVPGIPTVAVRENDWLIAGSEGASVHRYALAGGQPTTETLAPADGGSTKVGLIATDCTKDFALREDRTVWTRTERTGFKPAVSVTGNVYHLAADADRLWVATADSGNVTGYTTSGSTAKVSDGNIWRVRVDPAGLYWAAHDRAVPTTVGGRIYALFR